jgi:hypothetical protein
MNSLEWLPVVAALAILVGRYMWTLKRSEELRLSIEIRHAWVRRILAGPGSEVLAVQTVRNSIMASSLMATTTTLALMGVLTIGHAQVGALGPLASPAYSPRPGSCAACIQAIVASSARAATSSLGAK